MKKAIFVLSIILTSIFLISCSSEKNAEDYAETTQSIELTTVIPTSKSPTVPKTTINPKEQEENYKMFCDEYNYDDILFAPDRYIGYYCKFTGYVETLCNDKNDWIILQDENGNLIDVHCTAKYFEKNDKITVYGTISEVSATYYSNKPIPKMNVKYIDFLD